MTATPKPSKIPKRLSVTPNAPNAANVSDSVKAAVIEIKEMVSRMAVLCISIVTAMGPARCLRTVFG